MAQNDNQGSSGEDMLHADDDFREASVIDASKHIVCIMIASISGLRDASLFLAKA